MKPCLSINVQIMVFQIIIEMSMRKMYGRYMNTRGDGKMTYIFGFFVWGDTASHVKKKKLIMKIPILTNLLERIWNSTENLVNA